MSMPNTTALYNNPEFQSAMARLGAWLFSVIYVSIAVQSGRYDVDILSFVMLFAAYLLSFLAILVSVLMRPTWEERRYVSLMVDVSATTVCIYLTGEASTPFFILYIWVFVSYGARFGRLYLNVASMMSVLMYAVVVTLLEQWGKYFFEASFILLALGVLPIYQRSLIHQLHAARNKAERSNRVANSFLSNMTNEMRGPLVDILASSKDLSTSGLNMEQLDKVDDINSSASFLDSAIGDVLDFYKLEARKLQVQSAPFSMHILISEVCSSFVKLAVIKHMELVCCVASGVPRIIVGDEQRLKQVLSNVMRSAIGRCLDDELQISVQINKSNHEMLLLEVKGAVSQLSDEVDSDEGHNEGSTLLDATTSVVPVISPDLGIRFASRLIHLMGGEFESGPVEEGVIFRISFPAKTDGFESEVVSTPSVLHGKKAFIFEPNKTSRDEIVGCCLEQEMSVETVDKVAALSDYISRLRESQDIDIVIIADSPAGRDIERIADICFDVLGNKLPLVVLAYRRNCLDLNKYESSRLLRKPFIHDQLADAMGQALVSSH